MGRRIVGARSTVAGTALCCGAASVVLGLMHLVAAGAPRRYLALNAGALALGMAAAAAVRRIPIGGRAIAVASTAIGALLLATAIAGPPVAGASRWLALGGITLQPSLILVPMAVVLFARQPAGPAVPGLLLAALALGLQPDRAMAGSLVAGLGVLWWVRRERGVAIASLGAAAAFAATWRTPDAVPPAPFVEQVVSSSFAQHPLVGATVVAGLGVLLVPAVVGARTPGAGRDAAITFGAAWLAVVVASLLGNYPTPLVGYGSSAILGYAVSAAVLD